MPRISLKSLFVVIFLTIPAFAAYAANYNPFPPKDGDLSAILMILDKESLKEFEKPSTEGLHLQALRQVTYGETFAIKIGFSGMLLDPDKMADVTFDFKIVGPDKKIMGEESKDIPAFQGKTENRFMVHHSLSDVEVVFEPQDKAGTYEIFALLKDNIGKKSIPLKATIELIK